MTGRSIWRSGIAIRVTTRSAGGAVWDGDAGRTPPDDNGPSLGGDVAEPAGVAEPGVDDGVEMTDGEAVGTAETPDVSGSV